MKKSLIALAIAGAFVAPVAMAADATIYGHANVSFNSVSTGNGTTTRNGTTAGATSVSTNQVSSDASYLGVKGSEDLGGGLSAVWQIESGVNMEAGGVSTPGTASGALATRNTFAGLSSDSMGTLILGIHDTPYKLATRGLDLFADTIADNRTLMGLGSGSLVTGFAAGITGGVNTNYDGRQSNVVAYISPAMSGMTVAVAYVAGAETATSAVGAQKGSAWSLAGMYNAGPLNAALAYEVHDVGTASTGTLGIGTGVPTPKESAWKLGVGYAMDQFAVNFAYEKTTDNFGNTLGCSGGTLGGNCAGHSAYYLAGKFNVSASDAVKLAYTHSGDINGADVAATKLNTAAHQVSLGYDHGLSKRTTVYALYTKLTNGQGSIYALLNAGTNGGVAANGFNSSPSAVALGMKHTF